MNLQQRERVPTCFREDAFPYVVVQREGDDRVQQGTSFTMAQTLQDQLRKPGKERELYPSSEEQCHRICEQSPSDECHRLRRGVVQPWSVVDATDQRLLRPQSREQAQRPEPHQESIWWVAPAHAEHLAQSV